MLEALRTFIHGNVAERPLPVEGKSPAPGGIRFRPAATEESCDCPYSIEDLLGAELDSSCGNCCDSNCGCF